MRTAGSSVTSRVDRRLPERPRRAAAASPRRGGHGDPPIPAASPKNPGLHRLVELGFEPLAPIGRWRAYDRGAAVLRQGDRVRCFYVITSGRVKACCESVNGGCLILGLYGAGDVVGFASALGERQHRASVIAVEPVECLEVDRQALFKLLGDTPDLIGELLPRLARSLVGCTNCVAQTVHQHVESRLACLFLRLLDRATASEREQGWIPVRWSRQELAQLIGTTTESVSRAMSRWRERRLVVTADDGFWVRDRATLEQIALGTLASPSLQP